MLLLITFIVFLISNLCLATIDNDPKDLFFHNEQCKLVGDICRKNNDCCSDLICYPLQGKFFFFSNMFFFIYMK